MSVRYLSNEERETVTIVTNADRLNGGVVIIETSIGPHLTALRKHPAATLLAEGHWGTTAWGRFSIPARYWSPVTGISRRARREALQASEGEPPVGVGVDTEGEAA